MRAEIIIAVRKELSCNLRRTTTNINQTMGDDDGLTVVLDGPHGKDEYYYDGNTLQPFDHPRGPGQCRDFAIKASKAKYVILVDGHMTFPDGWVDTICAHLAKHPKDVTCCRMQGLGQHFEPLSEGVYHGCYLQLKHPHPSMKNWWICSQWNKGKPVERGVTGGIMGACYGMTREWYAKIGNPLSILEAWGGDEEILATCSWLMGGRCYLLPPVCGHIWAAKRDRPEEDYRERWKQWGNHYAMLEVLPVPEKSEMRDHLDKGNNRANLVESWLTPRRDAIINLWQRLQTAPHDWQWLKDKGVIKT